MTRCIVTSIVLLDNKVSPLNKARLEQGLGFNKYRRTMDMFGFIVTITMLVIAISARLDRLALIFMLLVCLALQQQDQATDKVSKQNH